MLLYQTEIQDAGMFYAGGINLDADAQLCFLVGKRNVRTLLELTNFSNYIEANGKVC
jgi:hypothetical protein